MIYVLQSLTLKHIHMKTISYNENCMYNDINIGIVRNGDSPFQVSARIKKSERSYMIALVYDKDGSLQTDIEDYSYPFDNDFYLALNKKMRRVALSLSGETIVAAE